MDIAVLQKPHYDDEGFDKYVMVENHRLFGVFDGMGTREGARDVAKLLANKFFHHASTGPDCKQLGDLMDQTARTAAAYYPHDGATATVARIDSEGKLHYAHVGDSRLYVMRKGRIKQITSDEGVGNMLLNYVGAYAHGTCQIGVIEAEDWDAFMLCTDGITGDWPHQFIYDEEIERLFIDREKAEHICRDLIAISKKEDDKTVMVVIK